MFILGYNEEYVYEFVNTEFLGLQIFNHQTSKDHIHQCILIYVEHVIQLS